MISLALMFSCLAAEEQSGQSYKIDAQKVNILKYIKEAKRQYPNVPEFWMYSIMKVESGFNQNAYNVNKNGSVDVGIMQINSIHFPYLSKFGITKDMLIVDMKLNIMVGAWELSNCINRFGQTWKAIGCYNGLDYNNRVYESYQRKVFNAMKKISDEFTSIENYMQNENYTYLNIKTENEN